MKAVVREYPNGDNEDERCAVEAAVARTLELPDSSDRLKVVDLVLWKNTHTVAGAAMQIPCSERTAKQWHGDFIRMVAENLKINGFR